MALKLSLHLLLDEISMQNHHHPTFLHYKQTFGASQSASEAHRVISTVSIPMYVSQLTPKPSRKKTPHLQANTLTADLWLVLWHRLKCSLWMGFTPLYHSQ